MSIDDTELVTLHGLVQQMTEAWNRGSGVSFAAAFSEDADFVAFEGTRLRGRAQITSFHQGVFDSVMKGSRLESSVAFVRLLAPEMVVLHGRARVTLPGEALPSPSRDSMQLFVARKERADWGFAAGMNARMLTIQRQLFWDDFESLSAQQQREMSDLMMALKLTGHR